MRDENRSLRQDQIERAAYAVLDEKGYAGASMLAIARAAKASNETLYNWYGDKTGLFAALVRRNASEVKALLQDQIAAGGDALDTLARVGPVLLQLVTSDRAVALNRAAAADPTGELGRVLAAEGRETVAPLIAQVIAQGRAQGQLVFDDLAVACETWLGLLIGDIQIRRVVGRMPQPGPEALAARADAALRHFLRLFAVAPPDQRPAP
ncbi:MAG: TetR/AcrR family transcriptional regulator [Rhodobacterales bacterium]|nr:TetR/AcrR family transcriptional regulator [Rhodobacterales bacterium]MDX5414080.1 TetR/AcrR family transcriptional regulator [Rhodobacterales bacterium]